MNNRKIVYWGTGTICRLCMNHYPDTQPIFFIDSSRTECSWRGIPVKKPDEVDNWQELFVVITTTAYDEIADILNRKGLQKNLHYIGYKEFFSSEQMTVETSIHYCDTYIADNSDYLESVLIYAPVFIARNSDNMIHFFRSYGLKRLPQKCILFSCLDVVDKETAEKKIGFPVFNIPEICRWNGKRKADEDMEQNSPGHADSLSVDEKMWIRELEKRKTCDDKELSFKITGEMYYFFKNIISIFQPAKILIWGGWIRAGYILAELAGRNNIPYGFMENGVIPGTVLFDSRGTEGQSEYAVIPDKLLRLPVKMDRTDVGKIRNYIIKNKVDTGIFRIDEEDERNIQRINKQKKTIFFAGMSDYAMGIHPQSSYWKKYVSSVFSSTLEAVSYIAGICRKNDWNIIFKPHPSVAAQNEWQLSDSDPGIIFIKHMEIDRLIQLSDVTVSISSAVNYKVLIYGKPLVQLGYNMLTKKGCAYEPENTAMVEKLLKAAVTDGMTQEQNRCFELHMMQLLEHCLWDDLTDRQLRYGLPLDTDFF